MHESFSDTPLSSTQRVQLPPQLRTVHGSTNLRGNHGEDAYARLLMHNACYEAMPTSNKMVVFDLGLVLRKAFNGLIYQNTRHVLVSDARQEGKMQGILSVTDFIRVMLRKFREKKRVEHALAANEEHDEEEDIGALTIAQYRDLITAEGKQLNLITVNADQSLLEAARLLSANHIHRLPVLDPEEGSPLFILTHKRILKFLWCFGQQLSQPEYHIRTAKELGVGAWQGIRVVFPDTPLVDCLDILLHKGVSGLPVVERNTYRVVDMYSRFDAIGIALEERANNLDVTVQEALEFKNTMRAGDRSSDVVSVRDTDTLWRAITVLVEHNVHRVCAVDAKGAIEGVISLSDVINFLVVKPGASLTPPPPRHWREKKPVGDMSDNELKALLLTSANRLEEEAHHMPPEF
ncbi:hypothetical protein PENTCL1PPCAC_25448 [Pristionchus entomophagus]|uniref:CBS domain-containing protein n=1 Tax=Pristionchus entomophagus TaxID=358040 RepID=A0AAV5U8T2_9BILA|nr:hypothetical protein PENTCL1PPCAC_25448 [Pristionchus entomophagus]